MNEIYEKLEAKEARRKQRAEEIIELVGHDVHSLAMGWAELEARARDLEGRVREARAALSYQA